MTGSVARRAGPRRREGAPLPEPPASSTPAGQHLIPRPGLPAVARTVPGPAARAGGMGEIPQVKTGAGRVPWQPARFLA